MLEELWLYSTQRSSRNCGTEKPRVKETVKHRVLESYDLLSRMRPWAKATTLSFPSEVIQNLGRGSPGMRDQPQEGQPCFPVCWSLPLESLKDPEGATTITLSDHPFKTPNFWSKDYFQKKKHPRFGLRSCHQLLSLDSPVERVHTQIHIYTPRSHPIAKFGHSLLGEHVCCPPPCLGKVSLHPPPALPPLFFTQSLLAWEVLFLRTLRSIPSPVLLWSP